MNEKYFAELSRMLSKAGISTAPLECGCLPLLLDGEMAGRVDSGGTICFTRNDISGPNAEALYEKAAPICAAVKEYTDALKRAPLLFASGLDGKFQLLSEFNGTVLAAHEMEKGHGMQFITWQWDYNHTGLMQGHYYADSYAAAKEDFAMRSGLFDRNRSFTDEQLTEMYRCICDTLDGCYELTDQQAELLEQTKQQIETAVPNLDEQISMAEQAMEIQRNQQMNQ